jgi:cytochrome c556
MGNSMSKHFKALVLGCVLAVPAVALSFAGADIKTVIETRQQNYKSIGKAFKGINDELKKDAPDTAAIKAEADTMDRLAAQIPTWFPKGSGPEAGIKTRAKPEIWTDPDTFADLARKLQGEVSKLSLTAASGDLTAVRAQVSPVGQACKACHEKFREPEDR